MLRSAVGAMVSALVGALALGLTCSVGALAAPQTVVELNLKAKAVPVRSPGGLLAITGSLPRGCVDNSEWNAEVAVDYRVMDENGVSFLRMEKSSNAGRAQLSSSLPAGLQEGYYRLDLRLRSTTSANPAVGVRHAGPPYGFVWSAQPSVGRDWKNYSFEFTLKAPEQALVLLVNQEVRGSLDIAAAKLSKLSDEDLIADLRSRYSDYPGGNLVRNSRFPLGLPAGWAVSRDISDGDDLRVSVERKIWGPSTFPALRLQGQKIDLASAPVFTPWALQPHVASIFVRGGVGAAGTDGDIDALEGTVKVMAGNEEFGSSSFWATPKWQRIEVPFVPVLGQTCYYIKLAGTGDIYIDGLQIEKGEAASKYAPRLPVEVAIGFPQSDASPARVQFDDEKAQLSYAVTARFAEGSAASAGLILRGKVVDVYGEEYPLPPVVLSSAPLQEGRLSYDVFPKKPYGQFRVEAWVENAAGKAFSSVGEAVVTRVRRPRYWGKDAPYSPFGVHTLSTTRHIQMAKAMGINWVRLHDAGTEYIGWSYLESEKGQWSFRDRDIRRYRQLSMRILGLLSTAPGWATNLGRGAEGYFDRYLRPLDVSDWAAYVSKVTRRYLGVIDTWEVWNEPWCGEFFTEAWDETKQEFGRSEDAPQLYADLQKAAFRTAKAMGPDLRIVGFNTTGNSYDASNAWTADVLKAGGLSSCDLVSYHHYASDYMGRPGDESVAAWVQAIGPLEAAAAASPAAVGGARSPSGTPLPKPVWMSEGSAVAGMSERGLYNHTMPFDTDEDLLDISNRLCRYVLQTRARGAEKVFLYSMHSHEGHIVKGHNDWRTLVTDDGYLHPSAAAFSAMAWLTEDTRPAGELVLAAGVNALLFEASNGSRSVAVLLPEKAHLSPYPVPDLRGFGVSTWDVYGNPATPGAPLDASLVYLERSGPAAELKALLGLGPR